MAYHLHIRGKEGGHLVIQMIVLLLFPYKANQLVGYLKSFCHCCVFDKLIKLVCFNNKCHNLNLVSSEFLMCVEVMQFMK